MIEFEWSWWGLLVGIIPLALWIVILVWAIGGPIVGLFGVYSEMKDNGGWKTRKGWSKAIEFFVMGICGYAILSLFLGLVSWGIFALGSSLVGDHHGTDTKPLDNHRAASILGFESGSSYPLVIGTRTGSWVDGGGAVQGQFFFGFGSVEGGMNLSGGSTISVSFENEDNNYLIEIPTDSVIFKIGDYEPSMAIFIDKYTYVYNTETGAQVQDSFGKRVCTTESHFVLRNFWPVQSTKGEPEAVCREFVIGNSLGRVVNGRSIDHAVIKLTQEMYDQLLGTIQ